MIRLETLLGVVFTAVLFVVNTPKMIVEAVRAARRAARDYREEFDRADDESDGAT